MSEFSDIEQEILRGLELDEMIEKGDVEDYDVTEHGFLPSGEKKYNPETKTFTHADPSKSWLDPFMEEGGGFDNLKRAFKSFSPDENTASAVAVDTGKAVIRAGINIGQSLTELGGLGLTSSGLLDEKDFIEFNQQYKDFENKLNSGVLEYDTEVYGPVTEVISQYLVPGMGLYKLYNNIIKIPGLTGILAKGLATDATLVTGVAPADEGNFVTFLKDTFNISEQNSGKVISAMVDYIGTVSNDPSAAGVAEQKFKNVLGDFPVALLAELIVPVVRLLSKAKNNAQSTTSNISSDSPLSGKSSEGTTGLNTELNARGPDSFAGTKDDAASSQTTDTLSDDTDNILPSSSKNNGTANLNFSIQDKVYQKINNLEELVDIHKKTFQDVQKKLALTLNLKVINSANDSGGKEMELFGRVKTTESLADKIRTKDKQPKSLSDIQGHRILVDGSFKKAIQKIENVIIPKLQKNFEVLDIEYKQHIGSYHVQLVNPSNANTSIELQIRPGRINKLIDKSHQPYAERKKYTQAEWDADLIRKLKNQAESLIISLEVDLKTDMKIPKKAFTKGAAVIAGTVAGTKSIGVEAGEEKE